MAITRTDRLVQLRTLMRERNVHVYIVPSEDSHSSEYIADCDARREFISGFTGSAGWAIVTRNAAALATDGRYFNQAYHELDDNWTLLKQGLQDVPTWQEWVADQSAGGKVVAVDPELITGLIAKKLSEQIRKAGGAELLPLQENLIDIVWANHRPSRPRQPVTVLSEEFSGKSVRNKIAELQHELTKKNCPGFFMSMLDEVAWLFNLRGSDIPFNPVFFSYAVVTPHVAILYIDQSRLSEEAKCDLASNDVQLKPYESFLSDARKICPEILEDEKTFAPGNLAPQTFLMSNKGSWALQRALGGDGLVEESRSPVGDAKAIKNETETKGMRECHIRDGAALIEFFAWLEDQLVAKKARVDEVQAAEKLKQLRSRHRHFVGLSFPTISSTGPKYVDTPQAITHIQMPSSPFCFHFCMNRLWNLLLTGHPTQSAAVIHYDPEPGSCAVIDPQNVYLCDSGAQYLDGTTDTTRTLHFGTPSPAERKAYTLVLKGVIALDTAVFPKGTTGFALDCLARQFLWHEGLDYRHGTGHGVGSYLNVHEGPIGIGTRVQYAEVPLAPGNVLSNEPGYYEDGHFGIRIENIMLVREQQTEHCFGEKPFLGFEHVTMVPYCQNLIDKTLLTVSEKLWLNSYSSEILDKTRHFFEDCPLTMAWLYRETRPIE